MDVLSITPGPHSINGHTRLRCPDDVDGAFDDRHVTFYEDDDCTSLTSAQQRLLLQHRRVVAERKREQEMQQLEIQRLDAILKMCEHYATANSFSLKRGTSRSDVDHFVTDDANAPDVTKDKERGGDGRGSDSGVSNGHGAVEEIGGATTASTDSLSPRRLPNSFYDDEDESDVEDHHGLISSFDISDLDVSHVDGDSALYEDIGSCVPATDFSSTSSPVFPPRQNLSSGEDIFHFPRLTRSSASPPLQPTPLPSSPVWKRISQVHPQPPRALVETAPVVDNSAFPIEISVDPLRSNQSTSPALSSTPPPKPKRSHLSLRDYDGAVSRRAVPSPRMEDVDEVVECPSSTSTASFPASSALITDSPSSTTINTPRSLSPIPMTAPDRTLAAMYDSPFFRGATSPVSCLTGSFRVAASTPADPATTVPLRIASNITSIGDAHSAAEALEKCAKEEMIDNNLDEDENKNADANDEPSTPSKTKAQKIEELRRRDKRATSRAVGAVGVASQSRPLTRFLPVRGAGDDFDLRAHVEASGHQIDECAEVAVDASTCRGYLTKIGATFGLCRRRWFVFDRKRRSLTYYADKSERKPRGGVYFQFIQETYPDHEMRKGDRKSIFIVKTSEKTLRLCAATPEAMRIWVDVIFSGAEGYDTYRA